MRTSAFSIACFSLLAFAGPALADWPAQGKSVLYVLQSTNGIGFAAITEATSGELMVVAQGKGGNGAGWNAVRLERDGDLAPGWTENGVDFGATGFAIRLGAFAADDSNGCWHARYGGISFLAKHALPDGAAEPAGPGWTVSGGGWWYDAAAVLGSSDVYFAYGTSSIKRFTRAGTLAPGWPVGGRTALAGVTGPFNPQPVILPDGAGGVVLFSNTFDGPRAARVDAGSALHAGWPVGGLPLGTPAQDVLLPADWPLRQLLPSGPGHFIAGWCDYADGQTTVARVVMQRFGLDATLDPDWPAAGQQIVAPDSIENVTLVADGEGGAYVLWERSGRPFGTHILANGSFAGGLGDAGVSLLPAGAQYLHLKQGYFDASTTLPYLVADRGLDGGLVFVWSEPTSRPARVMRVRWLLADLTPDPAEPDSGLRVVDDSGNSFAGVQRAALADGQGGIFLAWESFLGDAVPGHDWALAMTRVARPSVTGVPPAFPAVSFALGGAMPNPVRGSVALRCTLPDGRTARLDLFDVVGRRWRSVAVSGAGEHVVRLDDLGELPAGLYLARLTLGAGSRTSRFVRLP